MGLNNFQLLLDNEHGWETQFKYNKSWKLISVKKGEIFKIIDVKEFFLNFMQF